MAYQHVYPIHILNEIHNYFPDILYNRQRFQNVQDLLAYIQEVSEISPYDRGLQQYRLQQSRINRLQPVNYRYEERVNNISRNTSNPNTSNPNTSNPNTSNPNTNIPSNPSTLQETDRLINNVVSGFSVVLGSTNLEQIIEEHLQSFINQSVIVSPTANQIQNASIIFTATEQQDDICAICRDDIIVDQQARRLTYCNHCFHKVCIDSWLLQHVHCPTCRHDIRVVSAEDSSV
jgi:Ring finger domain